MPMNSRMKSEMAVHKRSPSSLINRSVTLSYRFHLSTDKYISLKRFISLIKKSLLHCFSFSIFSHVQNSKSPSCYKPLITLSCLGLEKKCGNTRAGHRSGEKGWRSGESARLPPMCPRFDSRTRRHMWVEFVVVVLYSAPRSFSPGTPVFPSHQKPTLLNDLETVDEEPPRGNATANSYYYYCYYCYYYYYYYYYYY